MPLSKARDKKRKRLAKLARLEKTQFQPKPSIEAIVRANPVMSQSVKRRLAVQANIEIDADGNIIPEE
jgi:hypothetical protein